MKKIQIKGKLSLNKATIANLNNEELQLVKGGAENGNVEAKSFWKHCHYPTCDHDSCELQTQRDISCNSACVC